MWLCRSNSGTESNGCLFSAGEYIEYTLDGTADITVHLSTDGGRTYGPALKQVSGGVGRGVTAGHKTIVWDVLAERDELVGDQITFQIRAAGNKTFTVRGVTFEMVRVQGGTFYMGCTSEQGSDCYDGEKPAHRVTLNDYYIGKTEVTQALWEAVMGSNPSSFKGSDLPVETVSWDDCQTFITKLNQLTGKTFRLPTEAEWEYAARGGNKSQGYKYSGNNTIGNVAWYRGNSGYTTHAVGTRQANELGIYDMSGNVWEWCSDWYGSYGSSSQTNPTGAVSGSGRVLRGGSWYNFGIGGGRVSFRDRSGPGNGYDCNFGLRLVF